MDTVKILSWIIAVVVAVVLIVRQATKAMVFRKVGLDDGFILLASVFAISLSVTTVALVANSRNFSATLTFEQAETVSKSYYASELLYIPAVCFPKLSLIVLFYNVVVGKRFIRRAVLTLGTFILTWTLVSLVTAAIQCGLPRPWRIESSYCLNTRIFWIIYCTIDIITEIALVTVSVKIVAYTQLRLSRRIAVISCFASRLLIVGVAVTRLIWLYPLASQHDHQHRVWEPMIASQFQTCLSIITASIPFIMPYCRELDSRIQASDLQEISRRIQDEETTYSRSSLWFRRHHKLKNMNSQTSSTERTVTHELLPRVAPCISFARSTTPRSNTRDHVSPEEKMSVQGLNIYIPHRSPKKHSNELVSPRSQSPGIWSPWSTSPQALLLHSFVPSRKAPVPPPRTPSVSPPSPSSCYSSRSATPAVFTPHTQSSLLSPPQKSTAGILKSQRKVSPLLFRHSDRAIGFKTDHSIPHSSAKRSHRTAQLKESFSHKPFQHTPTPNSSTGPRLQTALLSTLNTENSQPGSIQDLTSPMGAAIHSWFNNSTTQRFPQFSPLSPSSARDSFGQHTVSPADSFRMPTYPYSTHTRSPARSAVFLNEPSPSHSLYYPSCDSETNPTTLVRDVRNSPCVVVRNVL